MTNTAPVSTSTHPPALVSKRRTVAGATLAATVPAHGPSDPERR
jgi:hypothetical protein